MEETSKKVRHTREIMFRAWDTLMGEMSPAFSLFGEFTLMGAVHAWQAEYYTNADSIGRLNDLVVMQYVGQNDRKGERIFEGDIVKSWNLKDEKGNPRICEVVWNRNFYAIRDKMGMTGLYISDGEFGVEVIGNIYEHPHLLSQGEIKTELI